MRMAFGASRLLTGCTPIATASQAFAVSCGPAPAVQNPQAGCRESLKWMSRWGERDRDAQIRVLRARDAGFTALVESRHPALLSRSLSTAVSRLDALVEGASLRCAAAVTCLVRLRALLPLGGGLMGGREGRGESLGEGGGGEGGWFLTLSQPVQDTLASQR